MVIDQPIFGLIATMNPPFMLVWLPGLVYGLVSSSPTARVLGTAAGLCLVLFLASGVKFYFATPLFIVFTALGAILWERWLNHRKRLRLGFLMTMAISGLVSIPIAAPVLPPAMLQQVADFIRDGEQGAPGSQPASMGRYFPHFAEMHGWPGLVDAVATHYASIPEAEREFVTLAAAYYGQAGALNQLDTRNRLPQAVSGHMNYHRWSQGASFDDVLFVGFDPSELRPLYADIQTLGRYDCVRCMNRENGLHIIRARMPTMDSAAIRRHIKRLYFF